MAVDPKILQAETSYRAALGAGDVNARKALLKAYTGSFRALQLRYTTLTTSIQSMQAAGEPISASWLYQQQRYRDLQAEAAKMVNNLATALGQHVPEDMASAAKTAEALVGQASGPIFNKLPHSAIEGITGTTAAGSPLRGLLDTFNKNGTQDASRFLRSRLIAGIASGQSALNLANTLSAGVEGLTLKRALTISRTETQRALRRATSLSISNNLDLVAGWVWRSAADGRTCAACWSLHGTFFPGATPMRAHVNCRCVMIPKRKVKDDPLGFGNAVKVGNGQDLFKALPADVQRKILGPGRFDLYKSGKVSLSQMRTLRQNPLWGPSYQVKSLKDIKADLDKPPPVPKVPKPKPPETPGAFPSAPAVDPVPTVPSPSLVSPKAVPVSPKPIPELMAQPVAAPVKPVLAKATPVEKLQTKIAAQESKLLDVAEAEARWIDEIPLVDEATALRWRRGEIMTDQHMVRVRHSSEYTAIPDLQAAIQRSYYPTEVAGVGEVMYLAEQRLILGQNQFEWLIARTKRRVAGHNLAYSDSSLIFKSTAMRDKVFRALPTRTATQNTVLSRSLVEKALSDAKIAYERAVNPSAVQLRAVQQRAAPKQVTPEQLRVAEGEWADARTALAQAEQYDSWNKWVNSGKTEGLVPKSQLDALGVQYPTYGSRVYGDYVLSAATERGALELGGAHYGMPMVRITRLRPGMGPTVQGYFDVGEGFIRFSGRWLEAVEAPASLAAAQSRYQLIMRQYSAWHEYELLRKIGKKPITEIPSALDGLARPIPSGSSFAGKPHKWTVRDDFNNASRAKDQVSYEITKRLLADDDFIRAMANNDHLGEWIVGAGRSARPAVKAAADNWRGWTVKQREDFLRSGSIEGGYYEWSTSTATYGPNAGQLVVKQGNWNASIATDGASFVYDYTSQMVQQWAVTSGDAHILSVGLQRAAMEEFGLQSTTTLDHFIGRRHSGGYGVEAGDLLPASEAFYMANGDSLRRFLRQMYNQTQDELALAGIESVKMIRGVSSIPRAASAEWQAAGQSSHLAYHEAREGAVDLQPMSSFAVNAGTAKRFGSKLMYVDVPSSWIIGTCRTGFGCLNEYEWVVLGGPMRATIYNNAGY